MSKFRAMARRSPVAAISFIACAVGLVSGIALNAAPQGSEPASGVAVIDVAGAVQASSPVADAAQRRQVAFRSQFDYVQTRKASLESQLKGMVDKYNKDVTSGKVSPADLHTELQGIETVRQGGQADIQRALEPVRLSDAYVHEQIYAKVPDAVRKVMNAKHVAVLVDAHAVVMAQPGSNLTPALVTELNSALPALQLTPPAGWQPKGSGSAAPKQ